MVGKMIKSAYGLKDAPRKWWNRVDGALLKTGVVPTRADRCCYVLYDDDPKAQVKPFKEPLSQKNIETAAEYLFDPIHGSNAVGKKVIGIICLHVDDLFLTGTKKFHEKVVSAIRKEFEIGSEDEDDILFCGQRIHRKDDVVVVDQMKDIEGLSEIQFDNSLRDDISCDPTLHTEYRSVLGSLNWLQSRTQFHICFAFSRCASASAAPTIKDCRAINKLVRQVRANPVTMIFHPLKGELRIVGYPDASYRNNEDKSSQAGLTIFLAEARKDSPDSKGSLIEYASGKIKRTTLSTTVSELYAFMKCFGMCQFIKGLWMDVSAQSAELHMRTDANNLVTTAKTTHLPEQKETIHMITQLRKEATSGAIQDLAHVRTADMMADCLTKASANPNALLQAITTGILPQVDTHPSFRRLLQHKAYFMTWLCKTISKSRDIVSFLGEDLQNDIFYYYLPNAPRAYLMDFTALDHKKMTTGVEALQKE
jgi:hypothetical protein